MIHNKPSKLIGRTIKEMFFFKGRIMNDERYLFLALDDGKEYIIEATVNGKEVLLIPNIELISNQISPRSLKISE